MESYKNPYSYVKLAAGITAELAQRYSLRWWRNESIKLATGALCLPEAEKRKNTKTRDKLALLLTLIILIAF